MATGTRAGTWTVARALAELDPGGHWEIDAGRLVLREPPAPYHADATTRVAARLLAFVEPRGLGRVISGDPGFWLARQPDVLRAPDVAFLSAERARAIADPDAFAVVPPDLVVEIVSPGDRRADIRHKVDQYLTFGVRSVWVLDPRRRRLEQHRNGESARVACDDDAEVEDPVLPGFGAKLGELLPLPWPRPGDPGVGR